MGCDIHLFVERRQDSGKWERVEPPKGLSKYGEWFPGRSYDTFAILANVRNR